MFVSVRVCVSAVILSDAKDIRWRALARVVTRRRHYRSHRDDGESERAWGRRIRPS